VAALALMDSGSPLGKAPERDPAEQTAAILALLAQSASVRLRASDLRPLDVEQQFARVARELVTATGAAPETVLVQLRRRVKVMRAAAEAARHHEPGIYPGRIFYLRACDDDSGRDHDAPAHADADPDPSRGWSRHSTLPVVVQLAPGTHQTMIQEPHVRTVAALLDRILRGAD